MKVSHEIHSIDLIRISCFLENTNKLFASINFIKNFEADYPQKFNMAEK